MYVFTQEAIFVQQLASFTARDVCSQFRPQFTTKINLFHIPLYIEVLGQYGVSLNRIFWKVVLRTGDGYRGQL